MLTLVCHQCGSWRCHVWQMMSAVYAQIFHILGTLAIWVCVNKVICSTWKLQGTSATACVTSLMLLPWKRSLWGVKGKSRPVLYKCSVQHLQGHNISHNTAHATVTDLLQPQMLQSESRAPIATASIFNNVSADLGKVYAYLHQQTAWVRSSSAGQKVCQLMSFSGRVCL